MSERLGHVHIVPLALPGNAFTAGRHGGVHRHAQDVSITTEHLPLDPPPPYCGLHHGHYIYVVSTNGVTVTTSADATGGQYE